MMGIRNKRLLPIVCIIMVISIFLFGYEHFVKGKINDRIMTAIEQYFANDYGSVGKSLKSLNETDMSNSTGNADKLGYAKNEYLKNLMRKDGADYAIDICKSAVNIGVTIAFPEMTVGEQVVWELTNLGVEIVSSPGKNEDFGINSEGIATMTNRLKVRASIAKPGTKEGTLIYEMYPTSETMRRIEFYNNIFEHYKMDPIGLGDVCNNPEDVNNRILALSEKINAKPYVYNDEDECKEYKKLDELEDLYKNLNPGEIK